MIPRAVILAGGFGKRLNAITSTTRASFPIAKPACPVGNLHVVDFTLRALSGIGISNWHFAVFHLPETIQRVIKTGEVYDPKVRTDYTRDSEGEELDTAGSAAQVVRRNAWDTSPENVILVLSADIIHNVPLDRVIEAHLRNRRDSGALATIVVNTIPWEKIDRFGTVKLEGMPKREDFSDDHSFEDAVSAWLIHHRAASRKILEFREKKSREKNPNLSPEEIFRQVCLSNLNNSSIYCFSAEVFPHLYQHLTRKRSFAPLFPDLYRGDGGGFSDFGKHVFPWLIAKGLPISAYVLPERYEGGTPSYWKDAGLGEELLEVNKDVLDGRLETGLSDRRFWITTDWGWKGRNVHIDKTARFSERYRSIIGDGVVIEEGAYVVHSVILENTTVRAGATIKGSLIFPAPEGTRNTVGERASINDAIFTGGVIPPDAELKGYIYYTPFLGLGIDSLKAETAIP